MHFHGNNPPPTQERGLTVVVEPAVLVESTVTESRQYTDVRQQLVSWEDGVTGERNS